MRWAISIISEKHTQYELIFSQNPIVNGRSSDISSKEYKLAELRLKELSDITNQFVLRRTNALLSKLLPPKITMNVFCNMTPIQQTMYDLFTT